MHLRAWVSTDDERPLQAPPAGPWEEAGWVDTATETDLAKYVEGVLGFRAQQRSRSVLFYLSADPASSWTAGLQQRHPEVARGGAAPGERFWLALENSGPGGSTVASTAVAVITHQVRRPPEAHPAMRVRPIQVSVKARAGTGSPVFEKLR